jgi:tripartite motif-containing protein 71
MGNRALIALAIAALVGVSTATPASATVTPLVAFGTPGSAAGQLQLPHGVAVGPGGTISVTDAGNSRISQFDAAGGFIRAFGWDVIPANGVTTFEVCTAVTGCKAGTGGTGAGQLMTPRGIATDSVGDLFVTEADGNRVSVFGPTGDFLRSFGGFGVAAGQLSVPTGIALDDAGNVFVAELTSNRVSEFTTAGGFVRAFGAGVLPGPGTGFEACTTATGCDTGFPGGGAGQLSSPEGLGFGPGGALYAADVANHRVSEFTTAGSFVRAFGQGVLPGPGSGFEVCTAATACEAGAVSSAAGGLAGPFGVAVTPDGVLNVSDRFNNRIDRFSPAPAFLDAFGWGVLPGPTAGFEVCTAATGCEIGAPGSGAGQFQDANDLAADCRGGVWVADILATRIQRFGEPGTPPPTSCPTIAPPPVKPSNQFSFGKSKLNKRKGTATLAVEVPGAGDLGLAGKDLKAQASAATAAGEVKLAVKAKGKQKRKLIKSGKAKARAAVTFTPTGGDANTQTKPIKLVRRHRG